MSHTRFKRVVPRTDILKEKLTSLLAELLVFWFQLNIDSIAIHTN